MRCMSSNGKSDANTTLSQPLVPCQLAFRNARSAAYMLVCAQQMGTPLLTLDDALKVHAESVGIDILEI